MARTPVQAAGGIVLRQAKPPLVAVVRLRKRNEWVLPKGKLDDGETPREAAEREVNEETGHDVTVHEFLGTLVYESSGRSKIVHYWRMQAEGEQVYELMTDIREVDWLPLEVALVRLSRASERTFLEHVGPVAVASALADMAKRKARPAAAPATKAAAATKAVPAKKRRARTPVPAKPKPAEPVQPQPLAALPAEIAEPAPARPELPPVATGMPVALANNVSARADRVETAEPTSPIEAQAAVDRSEPMRSADPQAPELVVPVSDAIAAEPEVVAAAETERATAVETAEEADPAAVDACQPEAVEPRPKTLAQKLRNWLGTAALF